VQFAIGRIDFHAPRRYALLTSIAGFSESAAVYSTPRFNTRLPETFTCTLPATDAYRDVAAPVEFRIYPFAGQHTVHKTSLSAFKFAAPNLLSQSTAGNNRGRRNRMRHR